MANTYELIQTTRVTTAQSGIDFSSISSSYDDLLLYINIRSTKSVKGTTSFIRFNNDSGSNYEYKQMYSYASAAAGFSQTSIDKMFSQCKGSTSTANTFSTVWFYIPQYRGSYWKSMTGNSGFPDEAGNDWQHDNWAYTWKNTSAITSINMTMDGGNLEVGSVVSLYGIKYTA
jgi:hypothetical protein